MVFFLNWWFIALVLYGMRSRWLRAAWSWWFKNQHLPSPSPCPPFPSPRLRYPRPPVKTTTTTTTAAAAAAERARPETIVNPQLIHAVRNLRNDETDPHRRWLDVGKKREKSSNMLLIESQDAAFIVKELLGILRLEKMDRLMIRENKKNSNNNLPPSLQSSSTGLQLNQISFASPDAMQIFCTLLQQTVNLWALQLDLMMHPVEFLQILASLHRNTSVKELTIRGGGRSGTSFQHANDNTNLSAGLVQLLQNKSDSLQALYFDHTNFGGDSLQNSGILPCLGRKTLPHLRQLGFNECCLDDNGIESIIQALIIVEENNHHGRRQQRHSVCSRVTELDFSNNDITSRGLRSLCTYAAHFPSLEKLNLCSNKNLLVDENVTRVFVDTLLLSNHRDGDNASLSSSSLSGRPALKELNIADCCATNHADRSSAVRSLCLFIQVAFETSDCTLEVLDICCSKDYGPFTSNLKQWQWEIRNQLVDSLFQMDTSGRRRRSFCKLVVDEGFIDQQDLELMMAFYQNTSLLQVNHRAVPGRAIGGPIRRGRRQHVSQTPHVCAVLKRNCHLQQVESLLGRTLLHTAQPPTTAPVWVKATPSPSPRSLHEGLWSHVLSTVGKGPYSGTVVFLLLQDQLATWAPREEAASIGATSAIVTTTTTTSSNSTTNSNSRRGKQPQQQFLPENKKGNSGTQAAAAAVGTSKANKEEVQGPRGCFFRTTRGVFGKSAGSSSNTTARKVLLGSSRKEENFVMFLNNERPWTHPLHSLSWQQQRYMASMHAYHHHHRA